MTQIISRLYENHANATAAAGELRDAGFDESGIAVVGPMPDSTLEDITAAIMRGYVWKPYAKAYAEHVKRGCSIVTVLAPFGRGMEATATLEAHGSIDAGIPDSVEAGPTWDDAAPLSSALQMPVLARDPAPFSTVLGLPELTRGRASLWQALGLPELAGGGVPYSGFFPLPLLSDKAAPLSSMLGLPLLASKAAPLSSLFHLPLLIRSRQGR